MSRGIGEWTQDIHQGDAASDAYREWCVEHGHREEAGDPS